MLRVSLTLYNADSRSMMTLSPTQSSICRVPTAAVLVNTFVSVKVIVLTVSLSLTLSARLLTAPLIVLPARPACSTALPKSFARNLLFDLPRPVKILNVPPTHHHTPPATLSRTRRLRMKAMTRKKKPRARKMIIRSYQSAFSRCLTRWEEDFNRLAERSYRLLVERRVWVDSSIEIQSVM